MESGLEINSLEEINKVLDFNFKNSLSLETMQVSCPKCDKLYAINPHEVMSPRPNFNCRVCSTDFYINYPECLQDFKIIGKFHLRDAPTAMDNQGTQKNEVQITEKVSTEVGNTNSLPNKTDEKTHIAQSLKNNEIKVITCPKCSYKNSASTLECLKCSVVLAKVSESRETKGFYSASDELKDLWELVLDNYDSESAHKNFIQYSQLEQNLDYASHKYNSILSVNPYDDIANKMKKQIIVLSSVQTQNIVIAKSKKGFFRFFNLWTFSFILSFSIIGLGLYFPEYKNLIGIGAFSLSLIAGLKFLQLKYN